MVTLDGVVGVLLAAVPRGGTSSSSTIGEVAALSVAIATGWTLVSLIACWKNRRAAVVSRRAETKMSMTCPTWSIARST
jgi:hypothetical protein